MSYNETLKRVNERKKARIRERQLKEIQKTVLKPVSDNIGLVVGATALAAVGFASVNTSMVFAEGVKVEDTVNDTVSVDSKKEFAVKQISYVHKPVVDTDKTEVKTCTAGFSSNLNDISKSTVPTALKSVDVIRNDLIKATCAYQTKQDEEKAKALAKEAEKKKEEEKKALEQKRAEEKWNREVAHCKAQEINVFENWRTSKGNAISNSKTRTHMSYTAVTSHSSMQYRVLNSADAWSSEFTGLRMVGDRYCVAVGLKYGVAGDKIDLVMEDGSVVKAIIGDIKAEKDTDETRMFQKDDGSIVELITDGTPYDADKVPAVLKQHITRIVNVEGMEF